MLIGTPITGTPIFSRPESGDYVWFFGVLAFQGVLWLYFRIRYRREWVWPPVITWSEYREQLQGKR